MFETKGKMDEKFFKDNYFSLIGKRRTVILLLFCVFTLAFSIYVFIYGVNCKNEFFGHYYLRFYIVSFILFVLSVFLFLKFFFFNCQKYARIQAGRTAELYGTEDVEFTISFGDNEITKKNGDAANVSVIKYDILNKLIKSKKIYLLITKANQFVPIFADKLADGDKAALVDFLKEKTNIKNLK